MNLRARIIFATLLSAPINATYWAVAQNGPNGYMQTLPVLPLVWFGFWLRLPFDAAFYVLVANPLEARLYGFTTIRRVFFQLAAGAIFGALMFLMARLFGWSAAVSPLWLASSFAISALVWSSINILSPQHDHRSGWSASVQAGAASLKPVASSLINSLPWIILGWLAPFIAVLALFGLAMIKL